MIDEKHKKHSGKCFDCEGDTELVEMDVQKGTRVMVCRDCGLFHYYKKDFIGSWKLLKVAKEKADRD